MKLGIGLAAALAAAGAAAPAQAGPAESKALVKAFIADVFVKRDPDAAARYLAADYIQHNKKVPPGLAGFQKAMRDWFPTLPPDLTEETLHLVAEGDLVMAHNRLSFTGKDGQRHAVEGFDLYRVSGGRIVEHWDAED